MNRIRAPNVQSLLVRAAVARLTRRVEVGELTIQLPSGDRVHCSGAKPGPAADIEFLKWRAIMRILVGGEVGVARELLRRRMDELRSAGTDRVGRAERGSGHRFHQGSRARALCQSSCSSASRQHALGRRRNIVAHYDLGNEFYRLWLDRTMTYSSAIFPESLRRDPGGGSGDEIRPHHRAASISMAGRASSRSAAGGERSPPQSPSLAGRG